MSHTQAPRLLFGVVLFGYALAHIDDMDALYYRELGRDAIVHHHPLELRWSQRPDARFSEHLPPGILLAGGLDLLVGDTGSRLIYGAMTFATFVLLAWLMSALGAAALVPWMFFVVTCTHVLMAEFTQQRLDPPFVLLWVAALVLAKQGRLLLAGLAVGLAALLRAPQSLALLVLVPALSRARWRWWPAFAVLACLPLAAFAWLDDKNNLVLFWQNQVLASLTGAREDAHSARGAPFLELFTYFWPGMVGVLIALARLRKAPPAVWFALFWSLCVLGGLSLGKRHVWMHSWPAYPALFVLAAYGFAQIPWPRLPYRPVIACVGVLWTLGVVAFAGLDCDVLRFEKTISPRNLCSQVWVGSPDGAIDWNVAHRLFDHLGRPLTFVTLPELPEREPGCAQLISLRNGYAHDLGPATFVGRRHSFWLLQ